MKRKKNCISLRVVLLWLLSVTLLISAAAFLGASAEDIVSTTDLHRPQVSRSDVSRSDIRQMIASAQAQPKEMYEIPDDLGNLQISFTSAKAAGETIRFVIQNTDSKRIYVDWGDGQIVNVIFPAVKDVYQGGTVKIYSEGDITEFKCADPYIDIYSCHSISNDDQLTTLDVSRATALETLVCGKNSLNSLDVSQNHELKELWCDNNELTVLDVSNNPRLETLICQNNQLEALNVNNNADLKILQCDGNQLYALNVDNNSRLETLRCNSNQLSELVVTHNPQLQRLECSNNQLTSLNVTANTALIKLYCSSNQIDALNVTQNTALEDLGCGDNKLQSLDLSNLASLKSLGCQNNLLRSLDVSHNTILHSLYCDGNQLTALDITHNPALADLTCKNNVITELDLSENSVLSYLDCSGNKLRALDLLHIDEMMYLFCDRNELTSLKTPQLITVEFVCSYNQLNKLDVSSCISEGTLLDCRYNNLRFSTIKLPENFELLSLFDTPQGLMNISETIPAGGKIDLSSEYSVDGVETVYTWYDAAGQVVTPTKSENGVFTFGRDLSGKTLHCAMTNAKFPGFREDGSINHGAWDAFEDYEDADTRLMTTEVTVGYGQQLYFLNPKGSGVILSVKPSNDFALKDVNGNPIDLTLDESNGCISIQLASKDLDEKNAAKLVQSVKDYGEKNRSFYEIGFTDPQKNEFHMSGGTAKVCMKYPESLNNPTENYTFVLYHQGKNGVEKVKIDCQSDGIWFTAGDFSPYALAWTPKKSAGSPGTGESNILTMIALNLVLLSLAGAGAMIYQRRFAARFAD